MKNSSERKRYKTNPNFDAYLLYGAYAENMKGRLARTIKKAGRTPTAEELKLIDN